MASDTKKLFDCLVEASELLKDYPALEPGEDSSALTCQIKGNFSLDLYDKK